MLERYAELFFTLSCAKTTAWPDPRAIHALSTVRSLPTDSRYQRQLVELADIALCLRDCAFSDHTLYILNQLYRPRQRYCKRCHYCAYTDTPRCPRCHAVRKEGWSFEAFPTLVVLATALRARTGEHWSHERVRRFRNRAWEQIARVMRDKGLLYDGQATEETAPPKVGATAA